MTQTTETAARPRLAVIIGSVRAGRFGPKVASWFAEQAREDGRYDVDVIDLADTPTPMELPAVPPAMDPDPVRPPEMADLTRRLTEADAFVVVTPDYNRSYPASLKAVIDWHATQWSRKAMGFVGYSGASGGLLAIEHLRQVFGELHAHTVRACVLFPRYYLLFTPDGTLKDPAPANEAASGLLNELHWWTQALSTARAATPE